MLIVRRIWHTHNWWNACVNNRWTHCYQRQSVSPTLATHLDRVSMGLLSVSWIWLLLNYSLGSDIPRRTNPSKWTNEDYTQSHMQRREKRKKATRRKSKKKTDMNEMEMERMASNQQPTFNIGAIDNAKPIASNRIGIGFLFKCNKRWPFAIKYSLCSMEFLIKCNRICNFKLEIESIEGLFFSPFHSFSPPLYLMHTNFVSILRCILPLSAIYIKVGECYSIDDDNTAIVATAIANVNGDFDDDFYSNHFRRMSITVAYMAEGHAKNIHDFAYWHSCSCFFYSSEHTLTLSLCFSSYLNLIFN